MMQFGIKTNPSTREHEDVLGLLDQLHDFIEVCDRCLWLALLY